MKRIANTTAAWANSASANTAVNITLDPPELHPPDGKGGLLAVLVYSASTVTALTGKVQQRWYDSAGIERYATVSTASGESTFTVLDADDSTTDSQLFLIDGGLLDFGGRLVLSNNTVLGGSDGFTAQVQAWSL